MSKGYAVFPCNGLDKCAGCITHEMAVELSREPENEVVCPVVYRIAKARYQKVLEEKKLLVLDGCATRCASKLATEKSLRIDEKLNISEEAKKRGYSLDTSLEIGEKERRLISELLGQLKEGKEKTGTAGTLMDFPEDLEYETYKKDKFVFRVPIAPEFYFNENDVWAYVSGNHARIGVADFVQKSLSDIMFFTPPSLGIEIEQFDEAGTVESGKAVFEVICPVSGVVTSVNEKLVNEPELINQDHYGEGWIAELELTNFEEDRSLLYEFEEYFPIMKRKVEEFHV